MQRTTRRLLALLGLALLVIAAFGGGVTTYGALQDAESATASVGAAGNFPTDSCPAGNESGECEEGPGLLAPLELGGAAPARLIPLASDSDGLST